MDAMSDKIKSAIEQLLKEEYWSGYVDGKIDGVLSTLHLIGINETKSLELLEKTTGLSHDNAIKCYERWVRNGKMNKIGAISDDEKAIFNGLAENWLFFQLNSL